MRFEHIDSSYVEAIDYLVAHPEQVYRAWWRPKYGRGGSLFMYCSLDGQKTDDTCGCVAQINRDGFLSVVDFPGAEGLTREIRADNRIPKPDDWDPDRSTSEGSHKIPTRETLEVFAEYQTRMDEMALAMKDEKSS